MFMEGSAGSGVQVLLWLRATAQNGNGDSGGGGTVRLWCDLQGQWLWLWMYAVLGKVMQMLIRVLDDGYLRAAVQ